MSVGFLLILTQNWVVFFFTCKFSSKKCENCLFFSYFNIGKKLRVKNLYKWLQKWILHKILIRKDVLCIIIQILKICSFCPQNLPRISNTVLGDIWQNQDSTQKCHENQSKIRKTVLIPQNQENQSTSDPSGWSVPFYGTRCKYWS